MPPDDQCDKNGRGDGPLMKYFLLFTLLTFGAISALHAEVNFTILQTSDIHSHFLNTDSSFRLGGLARLATMIREIKEIKKNVLVLDSGDFTEGSIFFTLNSGEVTYKIMEAIGYDAVVLGNHDWLIGPTELYHALRSKNFNVPILSANLNFTDLDPQIELNKYLKPYVIKEIEGVKIGILGLSTFQFIFDSFFKPVKIENPIQVAKKYVEELRKVQGCKVVIVLSHLGFSVDRNLALNVPGIDYIVGGHTHILLKQPAIENKVPITHVGKWGHYLGQADLSFNNGKLSFSDYKIHEIKPSIEEDPGIKSLIDGAMVRLEDKWGPVFHEKVLESEVDLSVRDTSADNIVGNWIADSFRDLTHSDTAFENPTYASRDIYRGTTYAADIFDVFPNGYLPSTDHAWTVKTFSISGLYTKLLVSGVFRSNLYLKVSNAKILLDLTKTLNQVSALEIDGKPIDNLKIYKIAGTNGILQAIDFLKTYGIEIDVRNIVDSHREAWRVAAEYIKRKSPITADNVRWEGRVRTLQPDVVIRTEEIKVTTSAPQMLKISVVVRNTGMMPAKSTRFSLLRASNPWDSLSPRTVDDILDRRATVLLENIAAGEGRRLDFYWDVASVLPGRYAVEYGLTAADGEMATENNVLKSYIDVPETISEEKPVNINENLN